MMDSCTIFSKDGNMKVEIIPEYGGMITQIWMNGKEILKVDRQMLMLAPMAAGGCPILFPFASRTKNDTYQYNGKAYRMPMHGILKNACFAGERVSDECARVWISPTKEWKEQYFPFEFKLEVVYRVNQNELQIEMIVDNLADEKMPHSLGIHPFFLATDKKKIHLEHSMKVHYDYIECRDTELMDLSDLSKEWDHVFHTSDQPGFQLLNEKDGYRVTVSADPIFQSMVICSKVENSMCVEPWIGLPDSIHHHRYLHWIEAKTRESYHMKMSFEV